MTKQILELGRVVATPGAIRELKVAGQSASELLNRHLSGDWGDLSEEDRQLNDDALTSDGRVLSAYVLTTGQKVWVITEADRSSTHSFARGILANTSMAA